MAEETTNDDTKIRHPWDSWFNRKRFRLEKGVDYTCMPHSMAQQVRNAAFVRNVKVSIAIEGDVVVVTNHGEDDA